MKQYEEKYKEIFRYLSLGISRNEISKLLKTSRNTIRKVENAAESLRLTWNDASSMTSEEFSDNRLICTPYQDFPCKEINKRYREHISDDANDVRWDQGQSHSHSYGNGPSQFNDGHHGNQKYP